MCLVTSGGGPPPGHRVSHHWVVHTYTRGALPKVAGTLGRGDMVVPGHEEMAPGAEASAAPSWGLRERNEFNLITHK